MTIELEPGYRILFAAILFSTLAISAYHRRKARKSGETISRRAEGGLALFLRTVLAIPLLFVFLSYIFSPAWLQWAAFSLPEPVRWIGAGLGVLCIPLLWWVFRSIDENISETVLTKQEHRLVTEGPYRWIRHPLYTFALVELVSLGILASNWVMIGFGLVATILFRLVVIPKEEENLIKAFGQQYEDYRKRTGALVPRIG